MYVMIVNTKAYKEGMGNEAIKIAKIMEKVGKDTGIKMIIAVQPSDIYQVSSATSIDVFSQHVDAIDYGSNTGWILMEAVKNAGASGMLINHSEHRLRVENIYKIVNKAKKNKMESVICASNTDVAKAVSIFSPDYVAIEPPELIGGDISVTKAKPEIVKKAVEEVNEISNSKVLCGAGIKSGEDVRKAIELGADGILVASGVVKAKNKEKIIKEFAEAMIV
ncbi:MAG: triose-phosphate isomerase [Thermoplasmata archaeon]|nr:triose-phosphate isomerase [Thermoplasmata archaeon]